MPRLIDIPRLWRWMLTLYVLITFLFLMIDLDTFYRKLPVFLDQAPFLPWLPVPLFYLILSLATFGLLQGTYHRLWAFILWLIWREFLSTNPPSPMISDYYIAYGLGLLVILPLNWEKYKKAVQNLVWTMLGVTYFFSAWSKLTSPSWLDGSAVWWLGQSDLSTSLLSHVPSQLSSILSWSALTLELLVILGILWKSIRKYLWIGIQLFHVCILLSLNIPSLSVGMIIFQMILYDSTWWKKTTAQD